ncbi:MAG TPA: head morphogenesis protein [Pseudolabrys sp.]|nr:head morphogenesis protein [Pseudolabrys sp.]
MLRRLTEREQISILLDQYSLTIRQAFLDAIADIRSRITLGLIVERLEKGDIAGAIDAIHLERSAFNKVLDQIAAAFNAGGTAAVEALPILRDPSGHRLVIRFDARNIEAENWLREHSSTLVTRIVDDQREAIRTSMAEGLGQGQNPRSTALNVVGRVNRITGRREGGVIGLSTPQERYVASARQELLSGDPEAMRNYLGRGRRDKRFDKTVEKAISEGRAVPADMVAKITGRYSDRLLELRGEMLARSETMTALNVAKSEAMDQAIASGKIDIATVTDVWHSAGDDRVRHTHRALNGQSVPHGQGFRSPSGAFLRFPGDPEAPTSEIVGCRCWLEHKIDFLKGIQ